VPEASVANQLLQSVVVRRSTSADVDSFWRCVDAVARERRWLAFVEAAPIEQTRRFLAMQGLIHFVAVQKDDVVGWCDVAPRQQEGMRHCGELGIGLLSDYRGRGLGRQLLHEALEAARQGGIMRVELEVYASNTSAISLYERMGFVHEGRKRAARILDGRTEDILCMAWLDFAPGVREP
jgi:ribosomal protein S18 acetylase RimI-like enzyme